MIRFLAEIAVKTKVFIHPTPASFNKQHNIYYIDINEHPTDTYWTKWGGYYDNFSDTQIDLYFDGFLTKVTSMENLLVTPNSLYLKNRMVFINISKHPWLYANHSVSTRKNYPYLSAPLNPDKPSNNLIRGVNAQVKLGIPSFSVKLSDNIAGITLNQGFSVTLINNDGFFDNEQDFNLFNAPVYIKKAIKEDPQYDDFATIRSGLVENTSTTFSDFKIDVSDNIRAFERPACNIVNQDNFDIIVDDTGIGKKIPLIFGKKRIQLLKLNETKYLTAENATGVERVFNKDGISINYTFDINNKIITAEGAEEAIIIGSQNNRIGEIIRYMISRAGIAYTSDNINIDEFNSYASTSPKINFAVTDGNIRSTIESTLKSDMAYFIQQSTGKFTIRKFGAFYNLHFIPSQSMTKKPEKIFDSAYKNYFSSCIVNFNFTGNEQHSSELFDEREGEAESIYWRKLLKTFDTDLIERSDARNLAIALSDRFTTMRQTLKLAAGIDTSGFELLDTIIVFLNINGRMSSNVALFTIKEMNSAQDTLTVEESIADKDDWAFDGGDGTEDFEIELNGMYAETSDNEYDVIVDGGNA